MTNMTEGHGSLRAIDADAGLYILRSDGGGVSCYGFDNTLAQIERITAELVGRGVLAAEARPNPAPRRGSAMAWDHLYGLRLRLRREVETSGESAVCELSPQLIGLEGHRVRVVDENGEQRRFIVGRSTGWMPIHLELKRTTSSGGDPAARSYRIVNDLGRVR